MNKSNRKGLFLPILASLVVLVAVSVSFVACFGANSRYTQKRNEEMLLCDLAASSAIEEIKAAIVLTTSEDSEDWPEWWQGLLPPFEALKGAPSAAVPITEKVFKASEVTIDKVELSCVERQSGHKKKAQGLLRVSVEVSMGTNTRIRRTQLLQFYLQPCVTSTEASVTNPLVYHPKASYALNIFPLCSIVKG